MMRHPYRADIFALLVERAHAFGNSSDLAKLRGNIAQYALQIWLNRLRKLRKRIARPTRLPSARVEPIRETEWHQDAA